MFEEGQGGVLWGMMKLMHRLYNELHTRLAKIGLFRGQPPVLHFLCMDGPMSQKELADRLALSPATMTVTLKRMEKANLIERHVDPKDQRVQLVSATAYGREMNDASHKILGEIRDECVSGFSDEEMAAILDTIERMSDNLAHREDAPEEDIPS